MVRTPGRSHKSHGLRPDPDGILAIVVTFLNRRSIGLMEMLSQKVRLVGQEPQ
jgi:hypothetical protein